MIRSSFEPVFLFPKVVITLIDWNQSGIAPSCLIQHGKSDPDQAVSHSWSQHLHELEQWTCYFEPAADFEHQKTDPRRPVDLFIVASLKLALYESTTYRVWRRTRMTQLKMTLVQLSRARNRTHSKALAVPNWLASSGLRSANLAPLAQTCSDLAEIWR